MHTVVCSPLGEPIFFCSLLPFPSTSPSHFSPQTNIFLRSKLCCGKGYYRLSQLPAHQKSQIKYGIFSLFASRPPARAALHRLEYDPPIESQYVSRMSALFSAFLLCVVYLCVCVCRISLKMCMRLSVWLSDWFASLVPFFYMYHSAFRLSLLSILRFLSRPLPTTLLHTVTLYQRIYTIDVSGSTIIKSFTFFFPFFPRDCTIAICEGTYFFPDCVCVCVCLLLVQ